MSIHVSSSFRRRPVFVLALAGLCLALLPAWTGVSSAHGKTRIVWSTTLPDGDPGLVIAPPDGQHPRVLTDAGPSHHTFDSGAQFSPDGSQIAFEYVEEVDPGELMSMRLIGADGRNERTLDLGCVGPCFADFSPTWVPSGRRLVFSRNVGPFDPFHRYDFSARSVVLQSTRLDGSGLQRVSEAGIEGTYQDYGARYSPDGRFIVFERLRRSGNVAVFRMDADGTHVRRVTRWSWNASLADLSPATKGPTKGLIAFQTHGPPSDVFHAYRPAGETQNIATVPSTCTSPAACYAQIHLLTHLHGGPRASLSPAWSPDGRRIVYTEFSEEDANGQCCLGDIWTMRFDGTDHKPVSTSPRFGYSLDWGKAG